MPVKIKDPISGATGRAAIKSFRRRFKSIPDRVRKSIPRTVYPTLANITRGFFKENFINQQGWRQTNFSSRRYQNDKAKFLRRGDTFNIGSLVTLPIIHGPEFFGRRTDALLQGISSRTASVVKTDFVERSKDEVTVRLNVGIDSTSFDGGTIHTNQTTGRSYAESRSGGGLPGNELLQFSRQVSPAGMKSIFVRITRSQGKIIADYLFGVFGISVKNVFTRRM